MSQTSSIDPHWLQVNAELILNDCCLTYKDMAGKRVLDIGAGSGYFAWACLNQGIDIVSLDNHRDIESWLKMIVIQEVILLHPENARDSLFYDSVFSDREIYNLDFDQFIKTIVMANKRQGQLVPFLEDDPCKWREHITPPQSLSYIEASAENLPFENESFDLILSHAAPPTTCINTKETAQKVIDEALRVLRKGGEFRFAPGGITPEIFLDASERQTFIGRKRAIEWLQSHYSHIRVLIINTTPSSGEEGVDSCFVLSKQAKV